jgi:hypothetical protein
MEFSLLMYHENGDCPVRVSARVRVRVGFTIRVKGRVRVKVRFKSGQVLEFSLHCPVRVSARVRVRVWVGFKIRVKR